MLNPSLEGPFPYGRIHCGTSIKFFEHMGASKRVLQWLAQGVPFYPQCKIPLTTIKEKKGPYPARESWEITTLIQKGVLTPYNKTPKIFSEIFFKEKSSGELRMIVDMRSVNQAFSPPPFKMPSIWNVAMMLQPGDLIAKIDLSKAFFQIQIHKKSQFLFRCRWKHLYFTHTPLPMGFCMSPWTLMKVMKVPIKFLRQKGIRLLDYSDDIIIVAPPDSIHDHLNTVHEVLCKAGLEVNKEKCTLPAPATTVLGLWLNATNMSISIPPEKRTQLVTCLQRICSAQNISRKQIESVVGLLQFLQRACKTLRPFYQRLILEIPTIQGRGRLDKSTIEDLNFVISHIQSLEEVPIQPIPVSDNIWVDATMTQVAATRADVELPAIMLVQPEEHLKIHHMEMLAILFGIRSLLPQRRKSEQESVISESQCQLRENTKCFHPIRIYTDNQIVLHVVRKGGSQDPHLTEMANEIHRFCFRHRILPHFAWCPSKDNPADNPSRTLDITDYSIRREVFQKVREWARKKDLSLTVDLMASETTKQLPIFISKFHSPNGISVNAFLSKWEHGSYVHPPISLLSPTISKLAKEKPRAVLIAPKIMAEWTPLLNIIAKDMLLLGRKGEVLAAATSGTQIETIPENWQFFAFMVNG